MYPTVLNFIIICMYSYKYRYYVPLQFETIGFMCL